jgi:monothiol glutaredoxin
MSLDPTLRTRIDTLLSDNRVVLFMKGHPVRRNAASRPRPSGALNSLGVDYAHVDVLADPEIREGIKAYGDWPTIPQLYIGGELVGGSDIIEQMANSGELHGALGLPPPDRTPPNIDDHPVRVQMLRKALQDAGGDVVVRDGHRPAIPHAPAPGAAESNARDRHEADGIRVQFDLAGARRAEGLRIDWADDTRGRGLVIENPNAPQPVKGMTPSEAIARLKLAGTLKLVDVRPPEERALAVVKDTALAFLCHVLSVLDGRHRRAWTRSKRCRRTRRSAFLCHHGGRSAQAAEHFRQLGFREVYNVTAASTPGRTWKSSSASATMMPAGPRM